MKIRIYILFYLLLTGTISSLAQSVLPDTSVPKPVIGEKMPDFALRNVSYYSHRNEITLQDLKGKWIVLDFWASFCTPCISSFPKMSELQDQFKDKVQIIMVGLVGKKAHGDLESTRRMFDKLRTKLNLNLVVAYDSVLAYKWDIWTVPRLIIIDDKGIVRVSEGSDLSTEKLVSLLEGKKIDLQNHDFVNSLDPSLLFQRNRNDEYSQDLLFSSVISRHSNEESHFGPMKFDILNGKYLFKISAAPLSVLYKYAYVGKWGWDLTTDSLYGKIYPRPILLTPDSSGFKYSYKNPKKGLFNYLVISAIPRDGTLMEIMQRDLKNYFGHEVILEEREIPCWALVEVFPKSGRHLKTKGGDGNYPVAAVAGFSAKNISPAKLLSIISNYHMDKQPFFDYTEITHNIDITVDALMTDFTDLKKALNKNGLDLIKKPKKIMALVIR